MDKINILALSGSLRQSSYNTAAIEALKALAPTGVEVTLYQEMGELPLFNPDREEEYIPALAHLKKALKHSDGLVIASPEYAHGISGVLKNALDWLVSGEEFIYTPVMLINASPRASHAQTALREVVTTMSGNLIEDACTSVPLLGSNLDAAGIVDDSKNAAALLTGLDAFCAAIQVLKTQQS